MKRVLGPVLAIVVAFFGGCESDSGSKDAETQSPTVVTTRPSATQPSTMTPIVPTLTPLAPTPTTDSPTPESRGGNNTTHFVGECIEFDYPADWTLYDHSRSQTGLRDGRVAEQELVISWSSQWTAPQGTPGKVKLDLQVLDPAPAPEVETRTPFEIHSITVNNVPAEFAIFDDPFGYVGSVRVATPELLFVAGAFGDSPEDIRLALPVIATVRLCEALQ